MNSSGAVTNGIGQPVRRKEDAVDAIIELPGGGYRWRTVGFLFGFATAALPGARADTGV
jgi:hypothetical protein